MNIKKLVINALIFPLLFSGAVAHAEIYKWKDSEGRIRYSDMPPPSNVPQEAMTGKKIPRINGNTSQAPLSAVNGNITDALDRAKASDANNKANEAEQRAKSAEQQKKDDEVKEAALKLKAENCKASKANLQIYTDGGRIMRPNAQGEREFLSDKDIASGLADARKDVDAYCN